MTGNDETEFGFEGATFDSRLVKPGMLYVALKGGNVDGNDFIPKVLEAGAAKVIGGENALTELQSLARRYRRSLKGATVVALTGSAGKTTTKELLKSFLSTLGKTHATAGNYNNHLGLPITILNCPRDARFLVLEMGSNHPGEIAALCDIAEPDSGLVTNIGTAHIEFFKTREGIADEKGTLLARTREFGAVPGNCDFKDTLRSQCRGEFVVAEPLPAKLADAVNDVLPGEHNLTNASVAFALASRYGVSVEGAIRSLENFALPGSRWRKVEKNGVRFIDDTYNANPDAMKAALSTFSKLENSGRKIAVLGDMFELGESSGRLHAEVFDYASKLGLDAVIAVGASASRCKCTKSFENLQKLLEIASTEFQEGDLVLLKASNAMKLGKLTE